MLRFSKNTDIFIVYRKRCILEMRMYGIYITNEKM